jgi:methylglutaconyl-CoA hydratase
MMAFETISAVIDARGVATVTLNRPDKHNAMSAQMIAELSQAASALRADDGVRAVVLTGAGKTFCAGADLGWMSQQAAKSRAGKIAEATALAEMLYLWNGMPKPVIGRVQGSAYGGGIGLIAICDLAFAVEGARFALTETRLGLIPATIGPFVVRKLGEGFARQIFFTGNSFDTEFGMRTGFLTGVFTAVDLDRAVEAELAAILQCAPGAIADAKALCLRLGGPDVSEVVEDTIHALADRWETEEAQAGIDAFFAKETPPWRTS